MRDVGRRNLFKTFGAAAFLLAPALKARRARAQATADGRPTAKRFIYMNVPNGITTDCFPTGSGANFDWTGSPMAALTPFKSDLVVSKLHGYPKASGHPHTSGILTGNPTASDFFAYGKGPSINHLLARRIGAQDPIGHLNLWISQRESQGMRNTVTYDDTNFVAPVRSVMTAYNQVASKLRCAGGPQPTIMKTPADALDPRRKTILDLLRGDLRDGLRLIGMGSEEAAVLQRHVAALDSVETRFKAMSATAVQTTSPVCGKSGLAETLGPRQANAGMNINSLSRFMLDLSVLALATELTHVATIYYFAEGGSCATSGDFVNGQFNDNLHDISHSGGTDTSTKFVVNGVEKHRAVLGWFAGEFAYLLQSLQKLADGNSTLLKTSVTNLASVFGTGNDHNMNNMLWITAGGGGHHKTGLYDPVAQFHPRMLLSQLHCCGLSDISKVGALWKDGDGPLLG